MKQGIHPDNYRPVVFKDVGTEKMWLVRSTVRTEKKTTFEGTEYPLYTVDISSHSHPFYTGQQRFVDTEGRVERFQKKYGRTVKAGQ
jgi:large subunit ribosomal protein L31